MRLPWILLLCGLTRIGLSAEPLKSPVRWLDAGGFTLGKNVGAINVVAFSPEGEYFATSSDDGTLVVWNLATKRSAYHVQPPQPVTAICFTPDGTDLITASGDLNSKLTKWDLGSATGKLIGSAPVAPLTSMAFSPNSQFMFMGDAKGGIFRRQYLKRSASTTAGPHVYQAPVTCLFAEEDNNHFLSLGDGGVWRRWMLTPPTGYFIRAEKAELKETRGLGEGPQTLSEDRQLLGVLRTGGGAAQLALFHYPACSPLEGAGTYALPAETKGLALSFSPDGRTAAVGASDGRVYFWDLSAQLAASGIKVDPAPNPLMAKGSEVPWPEMTSRIHGLQESDDLGTEKRCGFRIKVTGTDKLKVGVRGLENGKVTTEGRDMRYPPGKDYMVHVAPGKYVLFWSKLLEPGIIHRFPQPIEVSYREYKVGRDVWAEWKDVTVTLDGTSNKGDLVTKAETPQPRR